MDLTTEALAALQPAAIRSLLPHWIATHVSAPEDVSEEMRGAVAAVLAAVSDEQLVTLQQTFIAAGEGYRLHPADPVASRITRTFMRFLSPGWSVTGAEHLDSFLESGPRRRLIVANHLSYTDTQLTDSILCLSGRSAVADRLVAIAGPKVYTEPWRRMAAVALHTRKTAQSSAVATEQDAIGVRELAAIAFETIRDCEQLMDRGYIVLLYPEGSRSRTGRLGPFLRAASRYLAVADLQVLPLAQTGSEAVYPIDAPVMYPSPTQVAFGPAFNAGDHPGKGAALAEAHARLARLLPERYRPAEGAPAVG